MTRAVVILQSPRERERARRWIDAAPPGTAVEFRARRRTVDQNAKLWAMLTDVSQQVEWHGEKLSPEDWKDLFTASLRKTRLIPGIDPGSFVPLGMRTHDMSKEEFGLLLDLIDAFGSQRGVTWTGEAG